MNDKSPAFIVVCVMAAGIIIAHSFLKAVQALEPPRNIYVTRTHSYRTFEGADLWLVEYAIDGEAQQAAFDSKEAAEAYLEYLRAVGSVREGGSDGD